MRQFIACLLLSATAYAQQTVTAGSVGASIWNPIPVGWRAGTPTKAGHGCLAASPTHLSTCNTSLSASTDYCVDNDVTAAGGDANACFNVNAAVWLDLNGHTVHGRIRETVNNWNGAHIYNGWISCTWLDSGANAGCIDITTLCQTTPCSIDNVKCSQLGINGVSRCIFLDPGSSTALVTLSYLEGTTPTCTADPLTICTRVDFLRINSGGSAGYDVFGIKVKTATDTATGQGVEIYGSPNAKVHHSFFDLGDNSAITNADTPRAVDFDGSEVGSGSENGQYYSNYVIARVGRALRVRGSGGVHAWDFYIAQCAAVATGCIHVGDNNASPNPNYNFLAERGVIEMAGGNAVWTRWATGLTFQDLTLIASPGGTASGLLGVVRTSSSATSTATFFRNNSGFLANPSITVTSDDNTGTATGTVCKSGTATATGTGASVSNVTGC